MKTKTFTVGKIYPVLLCKDDDGALWVQMFHSKKERDKGWTDHKQIPVRAKVLGPNRVALEIGDNQWSEIKAEF